MTISLGLNVDIPENRELCFFTQLLLLLNLLVGRLAGLGDRFSLYAHIFDSLELCQKLDNCSAFEENHYYIPKNVRLSLLEEDCATIPVPSSLCRTLAVKYSATVLSTNSYVCCVHYLVCDKGEWNFLLFSFNKDFLVSPFWFHL